MDCCPCYLLSFVLLKSHDYCFASNFLANCIALFCFALYCIELLHCVTSHFLVAFQTLHSKHPSPIMVWVNDMIISNNILQYSCSVLLLLHPNPIELFKSLTLAPYLVITSLPSATENCRCWCSQCRKLLEGYQVPLQEILPCWNHYRV